MFFQVLSEQLATSITNVVEKIHSQQFRISQRLQWAAGANSSLNTTIDEFQRTCNNHKAMLEKEEALFGEVEEMAKAVIHLESSHTRIPAQTASDRETIQYLQRCSNVCCNVAISLENVFRQYLYNVFYYFHLVYPVVWYCGFGTELVIIAFH